MNVVSNERVDGNHNDVMHWGEAVRIHLLHLNDVHSQLEGHLRLGAALRARRTALRQQGEAVLTFDIGDTLDRERPETEASLGQINACMQAALQLDGWVFGNNEGLTIPVEQWSNLVALSRTSTFGTNLRKREGTGFPFFVDYKIMMIEDVRVGVFGLTPSYEDAYAVLGVQALDPFQAAKCTIQLLQDKGCHVIVCLSHLGLWTDRRLAIEVPGIDVILGGHSHDTMPTSEVVGQTSIFQPGIRGRIFGHTTLEYDAKRLTVTSITCQPVLVPDNEAYDAAMVAAMQACQPIISARLSAPVVALTDALPVKYHCESVFANILVDALFEMYPSDVGIMMAGALTASLLPGEVQIRHVHAACSTPTRPVRMMLTGADILSILAKGVTEEYYNRHGYGYGFRGAVVGYLCIANMSVVLREIDGVNQIHSVHIGDELLDCDRAYQVITCEYLWLSSVFPEFKQGCKVELERPLVRELLYECLQNHGLIEGARRPRYAMLKQS